MNARQKIVVAGIDIAAAFFRQLDKQVEIELIAKDGEPLDIESSLSDPASIDPAEPPAWWDGAWETVVVAGDPPRRTDPLPQTRITDPEGAPPEEEDGE